MWNIYMDFDALPEDKIASSILNIKARVIQQKNANYV